MDKLEAYPTRTMRDDSPPKKRLPIAGNLPEFGSDMSGLTLGGLDYEMESYQCNRSRRNDHGVGRHVGGRADAGPGPGANPNDER